MSTGRFIRRRAGLCGPREQVVARREETRVPGDLVDHAVVRVAGALVVQAVVDLRCVRVDGSRGIVAIAAAHAHTVAVGIRLVRGQDGVAVVVNAVALLGRAGMDRCDRVVAIARAHAHAVAVCIRFVRGQDVVTVVVEAVAELGRAGMDGRPRSRRCSLRHTP